MNDVDINHIYICTRCGDCCRWPGDVRLNDDDVDNIARYLGMTVEQFIAEHTELTRDRKALSLSEAPSGACAFLAEPNTCTIDAVKPQQCRQFPNGWKVADLEKRCPAVKLKYRMHAIEPAPSQAHPYHHHINARSPRNDVGVDAAKQVIS